VRGRRGPLTALYAANTVSLTGNVLTTLAVPLFVLETTGSAAKAGITGAFAFLPIVIAGVFGGAVVDRLGFRRTSIRADVASGATVALTIEAAAMARLPLAGTQWAPGVGGV